MRYSFQMPADLLDDTAESAIRNYLLYLEDPRQLVDQQLIDKLRAQARDAVDPIDRLRLFAELERAEHADESRYRLDFVLHAKGWAAANRVTVAAFRQMGLTDELLKAAGLLADTSRAGRSSRKSASSSGRSSVTAESIKAHVRSLRGTFTMADIQSSVGGSPMTVRKAVQALVDDGTITRLGPVTNWRGRGRAPIAFEVR
jgi:hypothetical protein